jgi:hypothetical protein
MRVLILILLSFAAFGQTNYPGALDTDSSLRVTGDNVQSTLSVAMAISDSVAVVASPTGWQPNMIATVCDTSTTVGSGTDRATKCTVWENMKVTAVNGNVLTVTRGVDGTSARAHAAGKLIANLVNSGDREAMKDAIIAIETALGPNLGNIANATPLIAASAYNFTPQQPGGSLIIGNTPITLTPVPSGVNGTDTNHWLYISGGTGTAEACKITGGAGTAGSGSGQIIINCAGTHSGAWTIQSATGGVQEAIQAAQTAGGGIVVAPKGITTMHAAAQIPSNVVLSGHGQGATVLKAADGELARTPPWANGGAPGGYYCIVCVVASSTNVTVRDLTVDENGASQVYSYISGDIGAYNATDSIFTRVAVINRMKGGTGVGMGFYGQSPYTANANNTISDATVVGLPGCTYNTGGGAYYIEGHYNRILNTYAFNTCDTAWVVAHCQFCTVDNAYGDLGTGQQTSPMFTLAGMYNSITNSRCTSTGSNQVGSCFQVDNGINLETSGSILSELIAENCVHAYEINNATFANHLVTDTTFANVTARNCYTGLNINGNAHRTTLSSAHFYGMGYAGVSAVSASTNGLIENLTITNSHIDHSAKGILIQKSGIPDLIKGLTITGNWIGDSHGTPVATHGVYLDSGLATNVIIKDNILTGATSGPFLFNNTWASAMIGPNITPDATSRLTYYSLGAAVASASTINPTGPIFHVTGTTTINTINVGAVAQAPTGCLTMIPDGVFATGTAGNIAIASTAVVGKALTMCYDSALAKWYPSY